MKKTVSLLIALVMLISCGCSRTNTPAAAEESEISRSVFAMNTYVTLTAYGEKAESALNGAEKKIQELDRLWSVTDENSEIYAVNHSGGKTCIISDETADILNFSLDMAKKTNGALDPTVYPLLKAWGFTTEKYHIPTDEELTSAMNKVDYSKVKLAGNEICVPNGTQLDLGAVAKGYIGDILTEMLKKQGINSALLNLGGNVQAIGTKPNGSKWSIGLRAPDSEQNIGVLSIENKAVITSGNYQKYFDGEDGKRYHHIIDVTTGKPAESGIISATVVGDEGKLCDALSTTLFIMGKDKAINYWRVKDNFDMILITEDNKLIVTEGIATDFSLKDEYSSYEITVVKR